ncbi:Protein Mo25 [Zea mays]|uniref:Protein Mo25 n=1 Tax=Zea mays TaxID=4577 RepID=A0A1D6F2J5_MAIZE|nr:Protein Mo25 [Zea mays]ONM25650.1 Protein Mo25 [Zea mays]ONM25653.1 Protein Mo25 [Zea mays]ONM25654.1 Protein Mo25 [Zea mays]ONM25657.1 Protein Mo25 [Zea mays]
MRGSPACRSRILIRSVARPIRACRVPASVLSTPTGSPWVLSTILSCFVCGLSAEYPGSVALFL